MSQDLSYCLIGDPIAAIQPIAPNAPALSGLWLWARAFREYGADGDIRVIWRREDLELFDIIHINYTPSNIGLPSVVRDELGDSSSTRLIMNVDLDISYHGTNWAYYAPAMIRELRMADMLFHVESCGAAYLTELVNKNVHTISHPVDVSRLFDYIQKEREPFAACIFHRYHPDTMTPFIAMKDLPLRKHLYGSSDKMGKFVASQGCWDDIIGPATPLEYIIMVSKAMMGCDLYRGYTFGRAIIEFAALGIPCVCSKTVEASRRLFPDTAVSPLDVRTAKERFQALLDAEFANDVVKYAHEQCRWYSLETRYEEMVRLLEDKPIDVKE